MSKVEKFIEPNPYKQNQRPIYYSVDEKGCFNCVSHRLDRDGYGRIDRGGREWQMHRYIYTIDHQIIIPPKMEIMHLCDNPSCLKPQHLEMGTHEENMRHKKLRNRAIKKAHKLTETETNEMVESHLTIEQLAIEFDVSHSTVVKKKAKDRISGKKKRAVDKPSIKSADNTVKKIKASSK